MRKSLQAPLTITAVAALAGCSLAGNEMRSEPEIYIFRHQQVWLTPDERDFAQCWNGAALICVSGLGRLSNFFCECPD